LYKNTDLGLTILKYIEWIVFNKKKK
jgi:hypothetical protein